MKKREIRNSEEAIKLLNYLNNCHDASMRNISFGKERDVDKNDGSLIYPFENASESIDCTVNIELIW